MASSPAQKPLKIHRAVAAEIPFILSLAEKEGWNPGLYDAAPFYAADSNGFFMGELDGKRIGTVSAVAYDASYGFLGLYIVLPEYRQRGYGHQLFKAALEYLGERAIGLDGVPAQQASYQAAGFQLYAHNIRFEGLIQPTKQAQELIDLRKAPFDAICAYDASIFGSPRAAFLKGWMHMPNARGLAYMLGGRVQGFGIIRQCISGWKIGPLFADQPQIATDIFNALSAHAEKESIFLDVHQSHASAMAIAQHFNMREVFQTARMYTKTPPPRLEEKEFGITSFELG